MSILKRWFGPSPARTPRAELKDDQQQRTSTRKELLLMAVRDTLRRTGLPEHWIRVETMVGTVPNGREPGLHLRLVLTEWEPRILEFTVALQKGVQARVERLDPLAKNWMGGISWRFAPPATATCPDMPDPSYWLEDRKPVETEQKDAAKSTRDHLRELFSTHETAFRRRGDHADFSPTQPMSFTGETAKR
jgi:hypothetical protein